MKNKQLRILHAPIIACNQAAELSRALDLIPNVESDYMIFGDKKDEWHISSGIDINLRLEGRNKFMKALVQGGFFLWAANHYDVFHFHSHISLLHPTHWDIPILKKFGKKILMSYWGCDVRTKTASQKHDISICQQCPSLDCRESWKAKEISYFHENADLQVVHMPESLEFVPDSVYIPTSVNIDYWRPPIEEEAESLKLKDDVVRIMHPVGNSSFRGNMKGTEFVKKAVETLKKEGLNVDFLFYDQQAHKEMRNNYWNADVVVEQLYAGWHGSTGLEGMACGRPVMTYLRPDLIKYKADIPIISVTEKTLTDELRKLVKSKKLREEIGQKSREYVLKYHDSGKVAKDMLEIYKSL